jgi:hypothetical protein
MAVAVQGELVSALVEAPYQIRVALGAFAHQVERGTYLMFFQDIQQARRIPRVRSIVKC